MTNEQINRAVAEELDLKPHWRCRKHHVQEHVRLRAHQFEI